jgi:LacI family transcriptional regulator
LALIGFDDFESADMLQTSVTVVRQPAAEMGTIAAMHLVEQLTEETALHIGQAIALPVELVIRRSCGCKTAGQHGSATLAADIRGNGKPQ